MEIRLQRLKERETERGRRREIKNKIEEGSNKGTHDDKMEDGDRETLMRKKKKRLEIKSGTGGKRRRWMLEKPYCRYIYRIVNNVGHYRKEGGQKDEL